MVEVPGELLRALGHLRGGLELDVHVGLGALLLAHGAVGVRHAVVKEHHVVLDHPQPLGSGYFPEPAGLSLPSSGSRCSTYARAPFRPRLLVVPQRKADRPVGLDVGAAEDARQLHNEGRARAVVVGGLPPADAVHVPADDVHLVGVGGADLRAVDLLALARHRWRRVEGAQCRVRLRQRVVVDAGARPRAAIDAAPLGAPAPPASGGATARRTGAAPAPPGRLSRATSPCRWRFPLVRDALDVGAAVAAELRFDPVHGLAIALGALTTIAELREALDRGLVLGEIETRHQRGDVRQCGVGRLVDALCTQHRDECRDEPAAGKKGQAWTHVTTPERMGGRLSILTPCTADRPAHP